LLPSVGQANEEDFGTAIGGQDGNSSFADLYQATIEINDEIGLSQSIIYRER
jgi:hypothetical protein